MARLVAGLLVIVFASPAAGGVPYFGPVDVEALASPCCCAAASNPPAEPQLGRQCCCELERPGSATPGYATPLLVDREAMTPMAPPGLDRALPRWLREPQIVLPRANAARAPPGARTLYAQSTSLLL